jgi:fermentation-respiration switch protein FrsA (DUF1100 family)
MKSSSHVSPTSSAGRWRRWLIGRWSLKRLLRSLIIIYVTVCLYVWFTADRKIFLPPAPSYGRSLDLLTVVTDNGHNLAALSLPNADANYTLIYSHGNAEDLGQIRPVLEILRQAGTSVVGYDYSGYGLSGGRPSERQAYQDIRAVYRYTVDELGVPPEQIVIHGRSVGGGPSLHLAMQEPIAGLILESTFTSAFRVVLPFPVFPFDKFPNRDRIPQIDCPVLILHGEADRTIPLWHGQTLYELAPEPKQAVWIPEATHNDLVWVAGDRYGETVRSFLNRLEPVD